MKNPIALTSSLVAAFLFSGCAQQLPLTSHAHMGHSLTAWHDTPGKQALLSVAEKELAVALGEANAALQTSERADIEDRFTNVVNALNPDRQPRGPGLQYGAIRALEGTLEHLEYAAQAPDASDNLLTSMVALIARGEVVLAQLRKAEEIAVAGLEDRGANASAASLHRELHVASYGDSNATDQNDGLRGLHREMQIMLDRETDPHYEPLPRRYVLGLVRLPNGKWGYNLAKPAGYGGGY